MHVGLKGSPLAMVLALECRGFWSLSCSLPHLHRRYTNIGIICIAVIHSLLPTASPLYQHWYQRHRRYKTCVCTRGRVQLQLGFASRELGPMDRKRQRIELAELLRRLARAGGGSSTRLSNVIAELKRSTATVADLPACRSQVERSVLEQFDRMKHTIDMPLASGVGVFEWELLDPALLLTESLRRSPAMCEAYHQAVILRPPSPGQPWNLIVGFDEFAPGNIRQVRTRRLAATDVVIHIDFEFGPLSSPSLTSHLTSS